MSQPAEWGVMRSGDGIAMTAYAERDDDSLDALLSGHKGPSAPAYAVAGTSWIDDSADPLHIERFFDGTNWIPVRIIDTSNDVARGTDCILGTAGGTAAAVTLATAFALTAYRDGQRFLFRMPAEGTGALTLNVDAIGAKSVKLPNGENPASAQLPNGGVVEVVYVAAIDTMVIVGGLMPVITTAARAILDDANNAAILTTLGFSSFVQSIRNAVDGPAFLIAIGALPAAGGILTGDVTVADVSPGHERSVGFRGMPRNVQSDHYVLALGDAGKQVFHNSGTAHNWTLNPVVSAGWHIGTTILLVNIGAGAVTIVRGSGVALRQAGNSTNKDWVLGQWGQAALNMYTTNAWLVSGAGLS